ESASMASVRADGLEQAGVYSLLRLLRTADHEVEGRIVPVRGLDRRVDHRGGLRQRGPLAEGQGQRVAEDDLAVLGPHLEMPHPGALVDQPDQLVRRGPLGL